MKILKIVGLLLAGAVLLLAVAAGGLAIGGAPLIAKLIETQGSSWLGHEIRLGRLEIDWGNPVRIAIEDLHVANVAWGSDPQMFTARRLEAELDSRALLRATLKIPRLELFEPVLLLERSTEGSNANWEGLIVPTDLPGADPELRRLVIHQGRFTYRNHQTGAETGLAVDNLVAEEADRSKPIAISASGIFQQEPFALSAELAPLDRTQRTDWPSPMRLDGYLGANAVTLSGTASDPWTLQGLDLGVDMTGRDLQQLLAALGVPIPRMPIYHLAGHIRREGARWIFESVAGQIGNSHLTAGSILVDAGPRVPYIRAELNASYLDLADLKGFYGGEPGSTRSKSEAGSNDRIIPDYRMPVEELRGFDADLALDAPKVKPSAGLPFERVSFALSLHDGTLRVREAHLALAQGELTGEIEYRATDTPPAFLADLRLRRLDLHRLLAGMEVSTSSKQTAGLLGGFARLRSSGDTQRHVLAALDGDIGLFLEGGRLGGPTIEALDVSVAEALGLATKNNEPRPVDCFIGRFAVKGGIATADTLLLKTASAVVIGLGNVNLGDETLFLDLKPYPRTDRGSLGSVRIPVSIRGTFATPEVSADRTGLAERLGAALGFSEPTLPAAVLPLLVAGLGEKNSCSKAFAAQPAAASGAGQGNSTQPRLLPQGR